jgi:Cd2+/Zn2+-exporting ATPase
MDAAAALRIAAALEGHSNHPVARAISNAVDAAERPAVADFTEHPGLGLEGTVDGRRVLIGRASFLEKSGVALAILAADFTRQSLVLLAIDGKHAATFVLADRIRPEARETLARLRSLGITDFVMLTGDRAEVAGHIARHTGITRFEANCLPEDKVKHIRELRAAGRKVMVVGDGLNDAPALAEGDLGVAMGALGNDVTVHTSDVALMSGDLRRLPDLLLLSAKTVGIINQNLLCGFTFILIAITLSTLGFVNPVAAAFFHEFSAFFVIFNRARLLRFDGMEETSAAEESAPEDNPVPA